MTNQVYNALLATPCVAFQQAYQSLPITITANLVLGQAHSLGAVPALVRASLRCITPEHNYAVNDEVTLSPGASSGLGLIASDATNVTILIVGTPVSLDKTAGTSFTITLANWKLILRAWV